MAGLLLLVGAAVTTGAVTSGIDTVGPVDDAIPVGNFSARNPSEGFVEWESVSMAAAWDPTVYTLFEADRGVVVRAHSEAGASGLGTRCQIDLTEHPILEWSWKAEGILEDGRAGVKGKHDFPARVYVSFDYKKLSLYHRLKLIGLRALGFDVIPRRSFSYAWANHVPVGTVVQSPYAEWVRHMAVQSGTTHVGRWMTQRRNVRADYRRIYGEEPPPVNGVMIMTDGKDVEEEVTAYYGDITFRTASADSTSVTPIDSTLDGSLRRPN